MATVCHRDAVPDSCQIQDWYPDQAANAVPVPGKVRAVTLARAALWLVAPAVAQVSPSDLVLLSDANLVGRVALLIRLERPLEMVVQRVCHRGQGFLLALV